MYTAFYELKQEPFHVTPDPEFLFPSPAHKEALAAIIYGIEQRKGFIAITGEVGVGKTTILRSYLEFADRKNLKLIYIYNSNLTFDELLTTVFQELGIRDRPPTTFLAVTRLHEELIEIYRKNLTVVLIIDEAQNIPVETLESLRMLSNLETVTEKLIQIILIGQPEFDDMLQEHRLRQLRQRIAIHARIPPLSTEDSIAYLEHRLSKVAHGERPVFTKQALRLIAEAANGIPRTLNILSDNALITGFGYQARPVNTKIVNEVLSDRRITPVRRSNRTLLVATGAAAAALVVAASILLLPPQFFGHATSSVNSPTTVSSTPAPQRHDHVAPSDASSTTAPPPRAPSPPPLALSSPAPAARPEVRKPDTAPASTVTDAPTASSPTTPGVNGATTSQQSEGAKPENHALPPVAAVEPAPVQAPPMEAPNAPSGSPVARNSAAGDAAPLALRPTLPPSRSEPMPLGLRGSLEPPNIASAGTDTAGRSMAPTSAPEPQVARLAPPVPPRAEFRAPPVEPNNQRRPPPDPSRSRAEEFVRVVRAGDNLWTLTEAVYGYVNPDVIRRVQDANPHIRNINWLSPGQEIVFPRTPMAGPSRPAGVFSFSRGIREPGQD